MLPIIRVLVLRELIEPSAFICKLYLYTTNILSPANSIDWLGNTAEERLPDSTIKIAVI